jgi:hypothetical protein
MNYKELDIKPISEALKTALVDYIKMHLATNPEPAVDYGNFETSDKNSIAYIDSRSNWENTYGKAGTVTFYAIPENLRNQLIEYYQDVDHPLFKNDKYYFQIINNAAHVPPHVDDRIARTEGLLYLLESGGTDVKTTWYSAADGRDNSIIPDRVAIPYENLNVIESHVLRENYWHYMVFNAPHGVENLRSMRIAINFAP